MVCLCEHRVKVVQGEVLREQLVRQPVDADERLQLHHPCQVAGLEAGDGQVK